MNLNPFMILAHMANVLVLYLILKRILYKPVLKFLKERENKFQRIRDDLSEQEKEVEKLKREYMEKIENAKDEAARIIDQAHLLAEERSEEIIKKAKSQAQELLDRARRQIEYEKSQVQDLLKAETAAMAIEIAAKIVQKEITLEDNQKLIDEFLKKVG